MREMKAIVGSVGAGLRFERKKTSVVTCLFADETVFLGESKGDLQRVVK